MTIANEMKDELIEQLNLLRSIPLDDSAQAEKIDALWKQMLVFKSLGASEVPDSRSRRAQAETAREQAQMEAIRSTQLLCARMRSEASAQLQEAADAKARADKLKTQAEAEYAEAREAREKVDQETARLIAEAEAQAEQIRTTAREESEHEATELRRSAMQEIKSVLDRVEQLQLATKEEYETQRIFSNVSKIKAGSRWLLNKGDDPLDELMDLDPTTPLAVAKMRAEALNAISEQEDPSDSAGSHRAAEAEHASQATAADESAAGPEDPGPSDQGRGKGGNKRSSRR